MAFIAPALLGTAATAGVAGAAGTAATAGLIGTAGSLSMGTLLSLGLTGAGAFSQISAGKQQAAIYKQQADQTALNTQLEGIRGRQEALSIKKDRDQKLASINATYAARGGYSGSGTPAQAIFESRKNASEDLDVARFNSSMTQNQYKQQRVNQLSEGKAAKSGGVTNAFLSVGSSSYVQSLLDI